MTTDAMIPGAPELHEYATAMTLAGITHSDLVKHVSPPPQQHDTDPTGSVNQVNQVEGCKAKGVSVVLSTEARDTASISADAIERARQTVTRETNAIQSRFVLGLVPSIRQGDAGQ